MCDCFDIFCYITITGGDFAGKLLAAGVIEMHSPLWMHLLSGLPKITL